MTVLRTRAIVLRRTNYGEADRILQLITPEGKKSVMARGVRREKSRLAGGIELLAISDVVINSGKGELGILTSARLVQFYRHIMEDYDRMQFAYEAIRQVSRASESAETGEWYEVLSEVLMTLDARSVPRGLVEAWFYVRYAALLGYELSLSSDVDGKPLRSEAAYTYDEAEKGLRESTAGELSAEHIKLLRLISVKPLRVLVQIGGIENVINDCLLVARRHAAVPA